MIPPAGLLEHLPKGLRVEFECDAILGGVTIATSLKINGGSVRGGTSRVRYDYSVTIADAADLPMEWKSDPLGVWGQELHLRAVYHLPSGAVRIPVGVCRITRRQAPTAQGTMLVTGFDRMIRVEKHGLGIRTVQGSSTAAEAARLIREAIPGTEVVTDVDDDAVCPPTLYESDRGRAVDQLAAAVSARAYVDPSGTPHLRTRPDPRTAVAAWTIVDGEGGALTASQVTDDTDDLANEVLVKGERTDGSEPVWGVARDLDKFSPTYWGDPLTDPLGDLGTAAAFGRVSKEANLPVMTTQGQADKAAQTLLGSHLGVRRGVEFAALPAFWLEPEETVAVKTRAGLVRVLLDTVAFDLRVSDDMGVQCTGRTVDYSAV